MKTVETVKVQYAKTHLSAILARVESGEEVVIARGETPIARLTPIAAPATRKLGGFRYTVPDSFFDDLPEDELRAWEGDL